MISRAGWGAAPPKSSPTPWNVANLEGFCQHWFGSPTAADTHAGCDNLLRGVQAGHQAGEYNDIAYNFGVCPHGETYALRGWDVMTGANGDTEANQKFIAFVYMAGTGDPLTLAAKDALKRLYATGLAKGIGKKAITHHSVTGTECPGPQLSAWLASGAQWPDPRRWKHQLITGTVKIRVHDSSSVAKTSELSDRLKTFSSRVAGAYEKLASDGKKPRIRTVRV